MLEHQKLILRKVSDDPELFRKELLKSISWLQSYEIIKLHAWLRNEFDNNHANLVANVFGLYAA